MFLLPYCNAPAAGARSHENSMLATRQPTLFRRLGERTCHSDFHGDANAIACADWCKREKAANHW